MSKNEVGDRTNTKINVQGCRCFSTATPPKISGGHPVNGFFEAEHRSRFIPQRCRTWTLLAFGRVKSMLNMADNPVQTWEDFFELLRQGTDEAACKTIIQEIVPKLPFPGVFISSA